ncbi:MAG TPA: helix-turn-helix transcriptional regulator [Chloroflexota bacterium]|nr:helix-turn-helix transcriptional regulator [Chloroflexota bacterium]
MKESFAEWFGSKLAERRDLTTMHVAALVGVLDGDVEDWLAGRSVPTPDQCKAIAGIFDVTPDEVLARARA